MQVTCLLVFAMLLAACGGSSGPDRGGAAFRSQSCATVTGPSAAYWDFMNGVIRADYPETYRLLPYVGNSYIHPVQPLYGFVYPTGWSPVTLADASLQLTGVNVVRADGQAVWRRLNLTLSGAVRAADVVRTEIDTLVGNLGIGAPMLALCSASAADPTVPAEFHSVLVTGGGFTANVGAEAYYLGGVTTVFIHLAVAPATEYDSTAVGVFFPLSGQLLGGGGAAPECRDGRDNDGDGKTDYPSDPGCASPDDDSEAG